MTTLSAVLERRPACGVYVLDGAAPFDRLQQLAERHQLEVFVLDGKQIRNKQEFLDQSARVFSFPDYFGKNWDAFWDCLTDMRAEGEGFLILYSDFAHFVEHARGEFDMAVKIFREAAEHFWQKEGKTLVVLLHDCAGRDLGLQSVSL